MITNILISYSLCSLIDQTIALCGPDGGISGAGLQDEGVMSRPLSDGGQEAWDLIMRLRSKTWIKAGLDPDNVPTRHDVATLAEERLAGIQSNLQAGTPTQPLGGVTEYSESSVIDGGSTPNLNWEDWEDWEDWDRLFCGID